MSFSVALLEWPDGPVIAQPKCLGEVDDPRLVADVAQSLAAKKSAEADSVRRIPGDSEAGS
jgi:hypothetical protein